MTFAELLKELGGLHDATITKLEWEPLEHCLTSTIEDIYFNFVGFEGFEHVEPTPGVIKLEGVKEFELAIDCDLPRVYEFRAEQIAPNHVRVSIGFWPSGRMQVDCERAGFLDPQPTVPQPR